MEYIWNYTVSYQLFFYVGNAPENPIAILQNRAASTELLSYSKVCPRPSERIFRDPIEVDITWFFNLIRPTGETSPPTTSFLVDRNDSKCHTPRRNPDVDAMFARLAKLRDFTIKCAGWVKSDVLSLETDYETRIDVSSVDAFGIFVPVVPLFTDREEKEEKTSFNGLVQLSLPARPDTTRNIGTGILSEFATEQKRGIGIKREEISKIFASRRGKLGASEEATLLLIFQHLLNVCSAFEDGMNYIEGMLRDQMIQAIGKELSPTDFVKYMIFHNRKFFLPQFQPKPFCHTVRRPDHYPEGIISINAKYPKESLTEPIYTVFRKIDSVETPMNFALNAATKVSFFGERYLHAYIAHQFEDSTGASLSLNARARQFSCFILLVGTIASASLFLPKSAIVIENKDDLTIPLICETLPTAKEFKDAIASLSPEQQRFAKAYRALQLEGTLFGICVLQIKPQLEKLLNLENDTLTQEIRLTQDLIELFTKYQIPSDLLSVPREKLHESKEQKLEILKKNVSIIQAMLQLSKKRELDLQTQKHEFAKPSSHVLNQDEKVMVEREMLLLDDSMMMLRALPKKKSFLSRSVEKEDRGKNEDFRQAESKAAMEAPAAAPVDLRSHSDTQKKVDIPQRTDETSQFADKSATEAGGAVDYTAIPGQIDSNLGKFDQNNALRPTTIKLGDIWERVSQRTILSPRKTESLNPETAEKVDIPQRTDETSQFADKSATEAGGAVDYTAIPGQIDSNLGKFDQNNALRPTTIKLGDIWERVSQRTILSPRKTESLNPETADKEKDKAYDLLDCLSRSGSLPFDQATLHVLLGFTHSFQKTLLNTLVQDNVNPIESVEHSTLIVAGTIQNANPLSLINSAHADRFLSLQNLIPAPPALE
eukprot:TRINITY_DN6288_c0_g1_i3.p1 TRINITY_DN6288_c0_g1~~TRINITY_DN6288_c0_g1_i3.p1  ORF type:complete len:959 (-),score=232.67 TRINITY_DN6288_c0_g1_i3:31-2679(-)